MSKSELQLLPTHYKIGQSVGWAKAARPCPSSRVGQWWARPSGLCPSYQINHFSSGMGVLCFLIAVILFQRVDY